MIIDTTDIGKEELYKLLIGSILPRPIAWIGTLDKEDIPNLAPFSFFNVASVNPPIVSVSILNKADGAKKDTLVNIQNSKAFSISIVSHFLTEKMTATGVDYPSKINEFEIAGVSCVACAKIPSVRVQEAKVTYECTLRSITSFGEEEKAGNLVLADVVAVHVDDALLKESHIDMLKLDAIGRASGAFFTTTRDRFTLE